MKILIVSQYFWPESFRINDLACELKKRNYDVEVLTGKPNYPSGKYFKDYSFFFHNSDLFQGIKIHRVPLISRGKGSGIRLSANYLSFVLFASIFLLFQRKRYDVTITFAISPITQAFPSLLHKRVFKSKSLIWLQDLWPESVSAAGKINNSQIYRSLGGMVNFIYRHTDKILIQSEAFKEAVFNRCHDRNKISYLPYWAEDLFLDKENIEKNKYKNILPNGFLIMFAGNIGEAQDFESIIKAAVLTKSNRNIKWIIVGDGRKKNWLEAEIKHRELEQTVYLLGRYPIEEMPNLFSQADIMLLPLKNEYIFSLTIPSKIQSYMAFGKPIITMLNGIGSQIVQDANCGFIANAGDYESLAHNVEMAYKMEKSLLQKLGDNALEYYNSFFSKSKIMDDLVNIISDIKSKRANIQE